jgi:hypothetical protein
VAAAVGAVVVTAALVAQLPWATNAGATSGISPVGGLLSTTTTLAPVTTTTSTTVPASATTSTTPPSKTTSTTSTTSTTVAKANSGGVPSVPVGGPPTTVPAPGKPAPPPPNPKPILAAVQSDLTQLAAIDNYPAELAAVADRQAAVTRAVADVQAAQQAEARVQAQQNAVAGQLGSVTARIKQLAIAAYVGLGYATAGGPTNPNGTVSTLGGLTGNAEVDAQEMLQLVADHVRDQVKATTKQLKAAQADTKRAAKAVTKDKAYLASMQNNLAAGQIVLATVVRSATTADLTALAAEDSPSSTTSPTTTPARTPGLVAAADAAGLSAVGTSVTTAPTTSATTDTGPLPPSPDILGKPQLDGAQLAAWFATTDRKANVTVPMSQLATDYQTAGQATGVSDDLAFAQSIVETGYFSFPSYGQLTDKDNNFAGIGACDSCAHGWSFKSAAQGVSAQLELLEAYASKKKVATPLIGNIGIGGCCQTWMALSGKWATNTSYGIEILTVYNEMLTWLIPQRLIADGLMAKPGTKASSSSTATAKGPTLAPLPNAKPTRTGSPAQAAG